jgi:carbonic anhydrase/acetyltransferase-like protein (isoleucine patch superfamily)
MVTTATTTRAALPWPDVIRTLNGDEPALGPGAFVHDAAEVIGRVRLGARASVWPGAVIRGDTEDIAVGDETNVQDGSVLHADPGLPCRLGDRVTVGHRACIHGCTVGDGAVVGIGAIVLNGATVGAGAVIGAGAVVPEGADIPANALALGIPAKVVRETTPQERARFAEGVGHYVELIRVHGGQRG